MSRKRLTAGVLALVVGIVSRTAVAAPTYSIKALRAVICCAEHCPKDAGHVPMAPQRCCVVDGAAADPASTGPAVQVPSPSAPSVAILATPVVLSPFLGAVERAPGMRLRAGPPRYLHTLQIRC